MTVIEQARSNANIAEERYRERNAKVKMVEDFFNGDQLQYNPKVGKETPKQWNEREKLVLPLTRAILEKKASIYEKVPSRYVVDNESIQTQLEEFYKNRNGLFQQIDLQVEMSGCSCVKIYYDLSEKIFLQPISSEFVFPLVDDFTGEVIGVCLRWMKWVETLEGKSKQVVYDQVWTSTEWQEFEDNSPKSPPQEHLYGCLPFVFFFVNERDKNFYQNPASYDTALQNRQINVILSDLRHVVRYQSFAILKLINAEFDDKGRPKIKNLDIGPNQFLALPKDVDARYESPTAAIMQILDIAKFLIEKMYETSQVPAIAIAPSTTVASGVSLEIQWYPMSGYLNKKRTSYRISEDELAHKTVMIWEKQHGREDIDFQFTMDFVEEQLPTSVESQMQTDRFEIDLGVITAVDVLMRFNPDLSEEEAEKIVRENLELTRDLLSVKTQLSSEEKVALEDRINKAMAEEGVKNEKVDEEVVQEG